MFKKKFLSVLMSCMMVVSLLPSAIAPQQTKAASTWRSVLYPENWTPGYTNSSGQFLHDFSYAGYERGEKDLSLIHILKKIVPLIYIYLFWSIKRKALNWQEMNFVFYTTSLWTKIKLSVRKNYWKSCGTTNII